MTPQVFGEYLLVARIAARSMAEVFLAVRLGDRSGRTLVLKRPGLDERASGSVAEALRREAEALRGLDLVGVVRLVDAGDLGGLPFVVVEHVRGVSLERLIEAGAAREHAKTITRALADVLDRLHKAGWVHGDVSPSNVLVDDAGEVVLVDFGLALREGTARPGPSGTAGYASPEAALGKPARFSDDVYAWGVLAAECRLGRPLFGERELPEAALRSELPRALDDLPQVLAALSVDPAQRPTIAVLRSDPSLGAPDAAALAARVEQLLRGGSPPNAEPDASPGPGARLTVHEGPPVSAAPPALAISTVDPVRAAERPSRAPEPRRTVVLLVLAVAMLSALGVGVVIGRRSARRDVKTTITLPMVPARTELELDGKRMLVPEAGRPIPIEPGRHEVTVKYGKRDPEAYEFVAESGDHLVIVPVAPAGKPR